MPADHDKFASLIVEGKTLEEAYRGAGGTSKAPQQAAHALKKNPKVDALIKEKVRESALSLQIGLVGLGPLAIQHMKEVLESKNKKDVAHKTKIAENVLSRTRDLLPREININHSHELSGSLEDSLEAIADYIIEQRKGSAAKVIEAVSDGESGSYQCVTDANSENENQAARPVHPEQEAEIVSQSGEQGGREVVSGGEQDGEDVLRGDGSDIPSNGPLS